MKVKVCGMRDAANIKAIAALPPDFMGFIFYPKSPRYVATMPEGIVNYLKDRGIEPVALFVDEPVEKVAATMEKYGFTTVQLHGSESTEYCDKLRERGFKVFKAVSIGTREDTEKCREYDGHADMLIIDNKCRQRGGSGKKFNWELLDHINCSTPFLLSGGIGPGDYNAVIAAYIRMGGKMIGVDLNSCFETEPGIKDASAIDIFIQQLYRPAAPGCSPTTINHKP